MEGNIKMGPKVEEYIKTISHLNSCAQEIIKRVKEIASQSDSRQWIELGYTKFSDILNQDDFVKYFILFNNELMAQPGLEVTKYSVVGPYAFFVRPAKPKRRSTANSVKKE